MNEIKERSGTVDAELLTAEASLLAVGSGEPETPTHEKNAVYLRYLLLPCTFLTVALLGGLRIDSLDGSFIFIKPALVCLIFAALLLVLFARSGTIRINGWFSESFTPLKNAANAAVVLSLFAAITQVFNSLIPEQGLTFWIVAFCFFWTLWNNLFADFDTRKLFRSLGGLFGLAFVAKYLVLANLAAPAGRSWYEALTENPGQEAITRLLDLPRFSSATGYIQFFAVTLLLLGLYLLPPTTKPENNSDQEKAEGILRN